MKKILVSCLSAFAATAFVAQTHAQDYSCDDATCAAVADVFGVKDGELFVLQSPSAQPISSIGMRVGAVIDQLSINFGNGDGQFAGASGGYSVNTALQRGEFVASVTFCSAPWEFEDGNEGTAISYLQFTSSDGTVIEAGAPSGDCATQTSDHGFSGFYGYAKEVLTGIGVLY